MKTRLLRRDCQSQGKKRDRRRDVSNVQSLRLQPEPPCLLDWTRRYTPTSLPARGSFAPNAVIAIAGLSESGKTLQEIYGDEVIFVPCSGPGFDIGLRSRAVIKENPQAKGLPAVITG